MIRNDCFAALRAGAPDGWGVALICGQGINAAAIAPDGRTARFAGIGGLSGDWGGGLGLGQEALAAAIRGRDGRGRPDGARAAWSREHFGAADPGGRDARDVPGAHPGAAPRASSSPAVFATAESGDLVAAPSSSGWSAELAGMALALMRRLGMLRRATPIVLAGGVFATDSRRFHEGLAAASAGASRARLVRLDQPPVLGAALLGLDALAPDGHAHPETVVRLPRSSRLRRRPPSPDRWLTGASIRRG